MSALSAKILSYSPKLYLPCDEPSGSSLTDVTGRGNTGTIVGSSSRAPSTAGGGNGVILPVGNNYITAPHALATNDINNASNAVAALNMHAFIRLPVGYNGTTPNAFPILYGYGQTASGNGAGPWIRLNQTSDDLHYIQGLVSDQGSIGRVPFLVDGNWHQLAMTIFGSAAGNGKIYIDGVQYGTFAPGNLDPSPGTNTELTMFGNIGNGGVPQSPAAALNGIVGFDELFVSVSAAPMVAADFAAIWALATNPPDAAMAASVSAQLRV